MSSKALVVYLMAGPETPALAAAAVDGGADIVEIGIPFSDPLADGPVIRRAGERALAQGMRTAVCLELLEQTRALVDVPLVPMTYASILEAYGWERFVADARAAGATSLIVVDLPAGRAPRVAPHPARRADLHRRQAAPRGRADRRLALPRHRHRHDRRPREHVLAAARASSSASGASPTSRSTPGSASPRRSTPARPPRSSTGSRSARGPSRSPRTGPTRCASTWRRCAPRSTSSPRRRRSRWP